MKPLLPKEAWLVEFRRVPLDELREWDWNAIEGGREALLGRDAPMERIRSLPGDLSDRKVWAYTSEDVHDAGGWFFPARPNARLRPVECSEGETVIGLDREAALEALAEYILPVRLLLQGRQEKGDLQALATAALDGDEQAVGVLADALEDAGHPLAAPLRGQAESKGFPHKAYPRTLGLSPDGAAFFVQTDDGYACRRSVKDGKTVRGSRHLAPELVRGESGVPTTWFSCCGRFLTMVYGRVIAAWRIAPWELLWKRTLPKDQTPYRVEFSPDGSLVGVSLHNLLRLFDGPKGKPLAEIEPPKKARALNLTDAGWAMLEESGRFGLWNPRREGIAWTRLPESAGKVRDALVSPDATRLVGRPNSGPQGVLRFYDVPGKRLLSAPSITGYHAPLGFTPDGSRLFTRYQDELLAWDGRTGDRLARVVAKKRFDHAAYSADGGTVASWSSSDPVLRAYPVAVGETLPNEFDAEAPITSVAVSSDGQRVAFAARRSLFLTEVSPTGERLGAAEWEGAVAVAYSGKNLIACRDDGRVSRRRGVRSALNVECRVELSCFATVPGFVAVGMPDGAVRLMEDSERESWDAHPHAGRVTGLAFAENRLLSCGEDGVVFSFDLSSGKAKKRTSGLGPLSSVCARRDSWAVVEAGKSVRMSNGSELSRLCPYSACYVDDLTLAVGCWGEVVLIRLGTNEVLRRLPAGEGPVHSVAFAATTLAAGGWDRKLRIWRIER